MLVTKFRIGILGATGMVGQQFIRLLDGHPYFEVGHLFASDHSAGRRYGDVTRWSVSASIPESIGELTIESISEIPTDDIDILFSALPSDIAESVEEDAARAGILVFSNANSHRMKDNVPILVPEINSDHIRLVAQQPYGRGFIVTNSNCSTAGLVFGLYPLIPFGIEQVVVTTLQAVSGGGLKGVPAFDILGNVIPHIKNEEAKMETETKKILGQFTKNRIEPLKTDINATCTRVPVLNGHLESVSVTLKEEISIEEAVQQFTQFESGIMDLSLPTAPRTPIVLVDDEDGPQPNKHLLLPEDPLGMAIKIGRIRRKSKSLRFLLLVHNTIRGAAGASILNAEYAYAAGYLEGVSA